MGHQEVIVGVLRDSVVLCLLLLGSDLQQDIPRARLLKIRYLKITKKSLSKKSKLRVTINS